ncbi:YggT family protein, partial [Listeria monocytogenes]|nr:YggT family protein [Listeria monocytogenes]
MQSILYQVVEIILFIIRWLPTLMFIYFL